jgi:hypothetical protein
MLKQAAVTAVKGEALTKVERRQMLPLLRVTQFYHCLLTAKRSSLTDRTAVLNRSDSQIGKT